MKTETWMKFYSQNLITGYDLFKKVEIIFFANRNAQNTNWDICGIENSPSDVVFRLPFPVVPV